MSALDRAAGQLGIVNDGADDVRWALEEAARSLGVPVEELRWILRSRLIP